MKEYLAELTERQRYWLEHVRACDRAGRSTVEYARTHGLESRAMYSKGLGTFLCLAVTNSGRHHRSLNKKDIIY